MKRTLILLFVLSAACCLGQRLAVGIKAGVRLSDDLESPYAASESKRYTVGPTIELALPLGFAFEFDALYSRFGYRTYTGDILGSSYFNRIRANAWEFPMLVKYRLRFPLVHPFVAAGYAPRRISDGMQQYNGVMVDFFGNRTLVSGSNPTHYDVSHGLVAGGGVELGRSHFRIAPEFRYTRWNNDPLHVFGSQGYFVSANQNEFQILLGVTLR